MPRDIVETLAWLREANLESLALFTLKEIQYLNIVKLFSDFFKAFWSFVVWSYHPICKLVKDLQFLRKAKLFFQCGIGIEADLHVESVSIVDHKACKSKIILQEHKSFI